jgi:bidirectional [NiFe] hydrogenase diaphorase subunit
MLTTSVRPSPPSDDKRWKIVEATMRRNGYRPSALIETLHTVQQSFGFLEDAALRFVAASLHVPLSQTFGVATFYHLFTLKPQGRHTCVVCMGTACYIKGAAAIRDAVQQAEQIKAGETTGDGAVSFLTARCLGACGLAPSGVFDGEVAGNLTPGWTVDRINRWHQP